MPDPKDSLEGKVEYALLAQLSDAGLEENALLLCGHDFEEQEGAQIVVTCHGGPETPFYSGNYLLRTTIAIRSPMDRVENETTEADPREVHRALVQTVRDTIFTSGIEAALTAHETDFTCNMLLPGDSDASVDGRYFITSISIEVDCVRADFA